MELKSTIAKGHFNDTSTKLENNEIIRRSMLAANRLIAMQKENGTFILIIKPTEETVEQMSHTRGILSAWALAEFGNLIKEEKYIRCAKKSFDYYDKILGKTNNEITPFNWTFMGQLSLTLKNNEKALEYAQKIIESIDKADRQKMNNFGCSLLSYAASFLIEASHYNEKYLRDAIFFAEFGRNTFETHVVKNGELQELVSYSELARTYLLLSDATHNKEYFLFSQEIVDWILKNQLKDGSFRIKPDADSSNSRASASIAESLALFPGHPQIAQNKKKLYIEALEKMISWMFSMQYGEENIHAVEPEAYRKMTGGFRRTYFDSDLWLDSIAHFLLVVTRLYSQNNSDIIRLKEYPKIYYPLLSPQNKKNIFQETVGRNNHEKLFFGKSYRWEKIFNRNLRKILAIFPLLGDNDSKAILGHPNDTLRNYSYVVEFLREKKILKNVFLENSLKRIKFKKAPAFYETYIMTDFPWSRNEQTELINCYGRGFGRNWKDCLGKALGEFLERYFHLFHQSKNQLKKASEKDLENQKIQHIPISDLTVFSEEQKKSFPEKIWNKDSKFYWEKCRHYSTGEEILIPAQLIYWEYKTASNEPRIRERNTSGLGGFFSKEGATLSALYELIQRDAFLHYWLNMMTPPKIDLSTILDHDLLAYCEDIQKNGFELICLYLPSDTKVPVIVTIIKDEFGGPYYSLGAGCNLNSLKALKRSIEEAWSTYYYVAKNDAFYEKETLSEKYKPFITPMDANQRLSLWSNSAMKDQLNFFISGESISFKDTCFQFAKKFKTEKEELDYVVKNVESLGPGYEVYTHLASHKILRQAGYNSARVIVPQFLPFYLREQNAPINHPRLRGKNINTIPHLFP